MLKRKSLVILSIVIIASCFSCGETSSSSSSAASYTRVGTDSVMFNEDSKIKVSDKNGTPFTYIPRLSPFNTTISITYYSLVGRDESFDQDFNDSFQRYHAMFDRHNYYVEEGKGLINNIKVLNDSYGSGTPVKLDEELYTSLKKSYGFSIASKGKFSIAIGNLSSLWDGCIADSADWENPYYEESVAQQRSIYTDINKDYVQAALATTPTSEELKDMLTFNDNDMSVTFNSVSRIDEYVSSHKDLLKTISTLGSEMDFSKPSLTLGGYGKGEATQLFADKHKDMIFLINSGASSVKCSSKKPDGKPWEISVANPYYNEANRVSYFEDIKLNLWDIIYTQNGSFNLSTSGYYNNYFYAKDSNDVYHLRSHIIDPSTGYSSEYYDENSGEYHGFFASTSVLLDDCGTADMYTTALMNCTSLEEASSLLKTLNEYTKENAVAYYLVDTKEDGKKKSTCYVDSSLKDNFVLAYTLYPELSLKSQCITTIQTL